MRVWRWIGALGFGIVLSTVTPAAAQGNYEIQVYGAETVEPHHTMLELDSNFTFDGSKSFSDGINPTNRYWLERPTIN